MSRSKQAIIDELTDTALRELKEVIALLESATKTADKSEPEPGDFTKELHTKWHGMTVQIKPEKAPVSANLHNELMRDLRKACDRIDRLRAANRNLKECLTAADKRIKVIQRNRSEISDQNVRTYTKLKAAELELGGLAKAFNRYGTHRVNCDSHTNLTGKCDCGYEQAHKGVD